MASEMKQKLERDLLVRNRLLAERDVVKEFVKDYDHSLDSSRIPVHLDKLNRMQEEFDAVQSRIELTDSLDRLEAHLMPESSITHTPVHRKQPTVSVQPVIPHKEEEVAIFMVAGKFPNPVARAATPKPEPNTPEENVSRHSPIQNPKPGKQFVYQRLPELVSVRNPILPERPPEEAASTREASGPFVRSNPSQHPIPSTSAHVGISGLAYPVEPKPPSQAKAIHVQGEKVHPPIGNPHETETRSEEEEESSYTAMLTTASLVTPVTTHPPNVAVVQSGEAEPVPPSEESSTSRTLSTPKMASAVTQILAEVFRHAAPAGGGIPDQASTTSKDFAEKVLKERERTATSKRARRKIEPFAEPLTVLPSTNST